MGRAEGEGMKPKPFEIIVEFTPQSTKTGIIYEAHQKGSLTRCKDCMHRYTECGMEFCEKLDSMFYHYEDQEPLDADFYCKWAEPKGDEDDC